MHNDRNGAREERGGGGGGGSFQSCNGVGGCML